jgi:PP-loop superfamily ATP-utilizing enzyme
MPQVLYPPLQTNPHMPMEQVAVAFAGGVQSMAVQQLAMAMQPEPQAL